MEQEKHTKYDPADEEEEKMPGINAPGSLPGLKVHIARLILNVNSTDLIIWSICMLIM